MYTTLSQAEKRSKSSQISILKSINEWISKEQTNYYALSGMLLIIGTGFTSIPVAIATGFQSFIAAGICIILAMTVNVMVISQQPLKTIVWTFLISTTVNILALIYLLFGYLL